MLKVLPELTKLKGMALDFLFPRWCVGCGRGGDFICQSCLQSLTRIIPPLCPKCGRPQSNAILCPNCVGWQSEIEGIRSPFRFEGAMRQAIHQLKYSNLRALAVLLAQLLYNYLISNPVLGEVLVPVPLHQKRLRERGYNQSSLLAQQLGKLINLPVVDDYLIRQRHAPPQARTSTVEERRSNVANAFSCRDHRLQDKQVMLIDDVSTSGATLDACAGALKEAGATSVWGLVLAREI
ncbi:MAG: ComF family protein [Dehalococcoidia bacterium]|nr:ComF family protein [Dehalococcoidia bacterium]